MNITAHNFLELDEKTKKNLAALFKNNSEQFVWEPGTYGDVVLKCTIIKHYNSTVKQQLGQPQKCRFEVLNDKHLGEGTFSKVYKSNYTLAIHEQDGLNIKIRRNDQLRIVKVQNVTKANPLSSIQKECQAMEDTSFFHSKPLVVNQDGTKTYIVEKKLPGIELFDLINDRQLCTSDCKKLNLAILIAYKTQIANKGNIHLDVKPENILVFDNGYDFEVYFIDYGFLINQNTVNDINRGSPAYAAPEIFNSLIRSQKTDIFSLGRSLMYTWGDSDSEERLKKSFYERAKNPGFENLFTYAQKPQYYQELEQIFRAMCAADMNARPDIDELISSFERLEPKMIPLDENQNQYDGDSENESDNEFNEYDEDCEQGKYKVQRLNPVGLY